MARGMDKLGSILMRGVRDPAISDWDKILSGEMKDPRSQAIHARLSPEQADAVRELLPEIVDTVLHHLLWTLERERALCLSVKHDGGKVDDAAEESDGLAGELPGDQGWIARFSQQRRGVV